MVNFAKAPRLTQSKPLKVVGETDRIAGVGVLVGRGPTVTVPAGVAPTVGELPKIGV
jgi:hypothetical protein